MGRPRIVWIPSQENCLFSNHRQYLREIGRGFSFETRGPFACKEGALYFMEGCIVNGIFYGIGVGPGDPELLTIKAMHAIAAADVIIAPKTEKKDGSVALSTAKPYLKKNDRGNS